MAQLRKPFVIAIGVFSLLSVIIMILMAGIMYALETPLTTCMLIASLSAVPLLVAVACFMPKRRTIALRILGFLICLSFCFNLFLTLFGEVEENRPRGGRIGMQITIIIGSGIMALKGRWPEKEEPSVDTDGGKPT